MLSAFCQPSCYGINELTHQGWVEHISIRPSLVQIIACHLFDTKPFSEPIAGLIIVNWAIGNKFQWNFNQNTTICIQENEFELVRCKIPALLSQPQCVNTLRQRQNGCHFPKNIYKCILVNENVWVLIKISLKFVPNDPISNIPALFQIMAWRRPGDKPLSESMMVNLLAHITRPQCVKGCSITWAAYYWFGFTMEVKSMDHV